MCIKGASIYIERMLPGGRLSHFTVVEKKIIICMKKEISLHSQDIHSLPILYGLHTESNAVDLKCKVFDMRFYSFNFTFIHTFRTTLPKQT